MPYIQLSIVLKDEYTANLAYDYFLAKDYQTDQISIINGATFCVSADAGEATLAASHLFDFLEKL